MKKYLTMKNTFLLIIGLLGFGICGIAQPFNVVWTDLVEVSASGNSLTKTGPNGWNAGAFTVNSIPGGENGHLSTTINEANTYRVIGLSDVNDGVGYAGVDYALWLISNGTITIREFGSNKGSFGNYAAGDEFRIERNGTEITYLQNGNVFYTSATPSFSNLHGDASMLSPNSTLTNVKMSHDENGSATGGGGGGSSLWTAAGQDIYYNTGNVGIGNDSPSSLLHVTAAAATDKGITLENGGVTNFQVMGDGRVFAREVEVTLSNFPDYVFANDYELMPLGQLKKYIETNHHLPNIPSAKEVEENGMGMGELNLKQVEKIEELTLYILQLDERLQKLEQENADLKKQLDKK